MNFIQYIYYKIKNIFIYYLSKNNILLDFK